jgi:hypothetical protein
VNGTRKQTIQKIQIKLINLYKLTLFVSSVVFCFLVPFTELFRHTTYMEHLVIQKF